MNSFSTTFRVFFFFFVYVPLPFSQGRSSYYSDRLLDFSVTTPRWYKDVYVNNFFPRTANSAYRMLSFDLKPKWI